MAYITPADLENFLTATRYAELTADLDDADTVVAKEIRFAHDTIDGYLRARYSLPFAANAVPEKIQQWAVDLVKYRLYLRRPSVPQNVIDAYEMVIAELKDVARGLFALVDDEAPPATPTRVVTRLTGQGVFPEFRDPPGLLRRY